MKKRLTFPTCVLGVCAALLSSATLWAQKQPTSAAALYS